MKTLLINILLLLSLGINAQILPTASYIQIGQPAIIKQNPRVYFTTCEGKYYLLRCTENIFSNNTHNFTNWSITPITHEAISFLPITTAIYNVFYLKEEATDPSIIRYLNNLPRYVIGLVNIGSKTHKVLDLEKVPSTMLAEIKKQAFFKL